MMIADFPIRLKCVCGPNHRTGSALVYSEQVTISDLNGTTRSHAIDRCISLEILWLNVRGITTLGSCCGHGDCEPLISTNSDQYGKMLLLGYEESEFHNDDAGGRWWVGWKSRSLENNDD